MELLHTHSSILVSSTTIHNTNTINLLTRCLRNPLNCKFARIRRRKTHIFLSSKNVSHQHDSVQEGNVSRSTLLWRALKLPIYSVAMVPLTVGSAAAYYETHRFNSARYLVLLASSSLVIAWLNLSNDAYDFDTGVDKDKKESVVNLFGRRERVMFAATVCLVLGILGLTWVSFQAEDIRVAALLCCSILCGYVYQCPPFRLSYKGLGEPLCFAAFGPLATNAFYFSQAIRNETGKLPFSMTVISLSILVGLTTTLILFCSHFHQIDGDRAVGKLSPLVRLGTERGYKVVRYTVISFYALLCIFPILKFLPFSCTSFSLISLPMAKMLLDFVRDNHNVCYLIICLLCLEIFNTFLFIQKGAFVFLDYSLITQNKVKIFMAKYYCVRLHSLLGATLTLGLVAARGLQI